MELDHLKYNRQRGNIDSLPAMTLLTENSIEKIVAQKSTSLLDIIDQNLRKNMQSHSVIAIFVIGIVLYYYDSAFWGYYFISGALFEVGMVIFAYKLRKNIHQNYEMDLSLKNRFKNIQGLILTYLKFNKITGISLCFILMMTLSLRNINSFNLLSIVDVSVLFRFAVFGLIFYFLHRYSFKKFAKPHQDMLVDLHYYIAELDAESLETAEDESEK